MVAEKVALTYFDLWALIRIRRHALGNYFLAGRQIMLIKQSAELIPLLRRGVVHDEVTRHALDAEPALLLRNMETEIDGERQIGNVVLHRSIANTFEARIARTFGYVIAVLDGSCVIRPAGFDEIPRHVERAHAFVDEASVPAREEWILRLEVVRRVTNEIGFEVFHEDALGTLHLLPFLAEGVARLQ